MELKDGLEDIDRRRDGWNIHDKGWGSHCHREWKNLSKNTRNLEAPNRKKPENTDARTPPT